MACLLWQSSFTCDNLLQSKKKISSGNLGSSFKQCYISIIGNVFARGENLLQYYIQPFKSKFKIEVLYMQINKLKK